MTSPPAAAATETAVTCSVCAYGAGQVEGRPCKLCHRPWSQARVETARSEIEAMRQAYLARTKGRTECG